MEKNEQQLPRLGEPVPAFEAMTTQGKISFPADYKGKWVILFSHPADFTPICTSEVLTFGARTAEFRALNCELIGLSVDSRNSHIAWLRTIREKIEYHLQEEKIAIVPGTAFGDSGEGYLRVSYAYSLEDLQKAISRIRRFVDRLDGKAAK